MGKFALLSVVAASLASVTEVFGVTACPDESVCLNPDGSQVTLVLHGDEFLSWQTTLDGYSVVRHENGFWTYARKSKGLLVASEVAAHDAGLRSDKERSHLDLLPQNLRPDFSEQQKARLQVFRQMVASGGRYALKRDYGYENFKGLVVLVEYNDCAFSRDDAQAFYDEMLNKPDYDGYMTSSLIPEKVECTGSVRDYFYDNSGGLFDPHFDVVGPVRIDYSQYDMQKHTNAPVIMRSVCEAADSTIDFSQYDTDGDGTADMVFFIFAGGGSNYSGNDERLLWPHASTLMGVSADGVRLGRYACSVELYGRPESRQLDGIGTICHEFSHILGLKDEYDTDYEGSGGTSVTPGQWSLMAQGSYLNRSKTPAGYSLFQRCLSGFAKPQLIDASGDFGLEPIDRSNAGYRINSGVGNEFFIIENRQQNKWDEYLPGHGMLVFRVDTADAEAWKNNDVNVNPVHNYYELLRATPKSNGSKVVDSDGDPFPGTGEITELTNSTEPSISSWAGISTPFVLSDIAEVGQTIYFTVRSDNTPTEVEDFETMPLSSGDFQGVGGRFCKWDFSSAAIIPAGEWGTGEKAAGLLKKGEITTSDLGGILQQIAFKVSNSGSSAVVIRCQYSTDGGATWHMMKNSEGAENISVYAGSSELQIFNPLLDKKAKIRICEYFGSDTDYCYIDNVTFKFDDGYSDVIDNGAELSEGMGVVCGGGRLSVTNLRKGAVVRVFRPDGSLVARAREYRGEAHIRLTERGLLIVTDGLNAEKIVH